MVVVGLTTGPFENKYTAAPLGDSVYEFPIQIAVLLMAILGVGFTVRFAVAVFALKQPLLLNPITVYDVDILGETTALAP